MVLCLIQFSGSSSVMSCSKPMEFHRRHAAAYSSILLVLSVLGLMAMPGFGQAKSDGPPVSEGSRLDANGPYDNEGLSKASRVPPDQLTESDPVVVQSA